MNFLGEPVDKLSNHETKNDSEQLNLLGNDRSGKLRSNKVLSLSSYITGNQQGNSNILKATNEMYRTDVARSQECERQLTKTVGFIRDKISHPEGSASSSKTATTFSNSHFDSDYFSQSQSPPDTTSPSTQNLTMENSNIKSTSIKTRLEPVALKPSLSEPTILLTAPAPLSQRDKKTNFLSKQASASRKVSDGVFLPIFS